MRWSGRAQRGFAAAEARPLRCPSPRTLRSVSVPSDAYATSAWHAHYPPLSASAPRSLPSMRLGVHSRATGQDHDASSLRRARNHVLAVWRSSAPWRFTATSTRHSLSSAQRPMEPCTIVASCSPPQRISARTNALTPLAPQLAINGTPASCPVGRRAADGGGAVALYCVAGLSAYAFASRMPTGFAARRIRGAPSAETGAAAIHRHRLA
jgi:hypothetical protein